jgi:DNA replication protein DnaC
MSLIRPKGILLAQLDAANIPRDYWEVDFSTFHGPEMPRDKTVHYLKTLDTMMEEGIGIMYAGPPGPGKTTLAMIAMKYVARAGWDVFVTSLGEIVERIQKSWHNNDEADKEFLLRAKTADFLFIDDVGKEHRGQSGFVQTVFDNLIRWRVQHRRPTFLTTNLTKTELAMTYGNSVISLIQGKVMAIEVNGKDHRRTVQRQTMRDKFDEGR